MKSKRIPIQIGVAILLGMLLGCLTPKGWTLWSFEPAYIYNVVGTLFINALMMVCVPLVSSSIITGVSRAGKEGLGRIGGKMFACYLGTTAIAVVIGLFFANLLRPEAAASLGDHISSLAASGAPAIQQHHFAEFFLRIIPSNIIQAFARGEMLAIVFFSLLLGYAISKMETKIAHTLSDFFYALFHTMMRMVHLILRFLPLGVFFLVARAFSETGLTSLYHLGLFAATVLLGLVVFMCVALPLLLRFVAGVSPIRHYKAMWPALVAAFSTSSSSATLPVALECVEKRAGVSNAVASLVIPLGTSVGLAGSALYECAAALFVAHVYGVHLTLVSQLLIVMLSLAMSIGVAGVPSGSLVAITAILKTMGLPMEGIGLFIAADRLLDMCRTVANIFSDSTCAVLVAKFEGEKEVLTKTELTETV